MSNRPRRRPSSQPAMTDMLGPLDGERIPGGCESCDAYQTVTAVARGVWKLNIHHDDWCPVLASMQGPAGAS